MNDPDDDLRELADWLRTSSSAEWCSKPLERAADAIDELLELRVMRRVDMKEHGK